MPYKCQILYSHILIIRIFTQFPVPLCIHLMHNRFFKGNFIPADVHNLMIILHLYSFCRDIGHRRFPGIRQQLLFHQFRTIIVQIQAHPFTYFKIRCPGHFYLKGTFPGISRHFIFSSQPCIMLDVNHHRRRIHHLRIGWQIRSIHFNERFVGPVSFYYKVPTIDNDRRARIIPFSIVRGVFNILSQRIILLIMQHIFSCRKVEHHSCIVI